MARTVATILSYGMGVESSAILLRWVLSPATRPCPLQDLIVITSQSTLLSAQRTQVDLLTSRLTASVQLLMSVGGGWDTSQMPTAREVRTAHR